MVGLDRHVGVPGSRRFRQMAEHYFLKDFD